jgi:arsenite methyltransferase
MNDTPRPDSPRALPPIDPWFDWLTHRRQGGPKLGKSISHDVQRYRDRVLDGARLAEGMTLADVGTGDGLVAFGAIARVGPSLRVIFADISDALLRRAEEAAGELGVRDQCTFVQGTAERLPDIAAGTVDVVTTRSVLVYLADKAAAAREFHRILKPGGRLSIAEPVYRDEALNLAALMQHLQQQPIGPENLDTRLFLRWKAAQLPSTPVEIEKNPLTNFSEHDLVTIFEGAGFTDIHLEFHIDVRNLAAESWETILDASPRPNTPTLREVLTTRFTAEERAYFEAKLRPLAESGATFYRDSMAYLTARKAGQEQPTVFTTGSGSEAERS